MRAASACQQAEPCLEAEIQAARARTRETFGPERLQKELAGRGVEVGVTAAVSIAPTITRRCPSSSRCRPQ